MPFVRTVGNVAEADEFSGPRGNADFEKQDQQLLIGIDDCWTWNLGVLAAASAGRLKKAWGGSPLKLLEGFLRSFAAQFRAERGPGGIASKVRSTRGRFHPLS